MKAKHVKVLLVVAIAALSLSLVYTDVSLAQPAVALQSVYLEEALPVTDPVSPLWDRAQAVQVPLTGQATALPIRMEPVTPSMEVRALNNGTHIVFLVSWPDTTKDERSTKMHEFRDAAALLLASSTLPGICMGSRNQRVHIVQWKADWQADMEAGFHDLEDAFPNFWVDHYPYAVGDPPYSLPDAFPEDARELLVGWSVGNPFSQPLKVTAVEDAVATGFGTIATQERQDAFGRGVWENDRWKVTVARRLHTGDPEDQDMDLGGRYNFALAVWDGSSGDVGARKSVSSWVTLEVSGAVAPRGVEVWIVGLVLLPPVAAALLILYVYRRQKGG